MLDLANPNKNDSGRDRLADIVHWSAAVRLWENRALPVIHNSCDGVNILPTNKYVFLQKVRNKPYLHIWAHQMKTRCWADLYTTSANTQRIQSDILLLCPFSKHKKVPRADDLWSFILKGCALKPEQSFPATPTHLLCISNPHWSIFHVCFSDRIHPLMYNSSWYKQRKKDFL